MSRVSENLYGLGINKLTDSTTGTASDTVNDTTAGQRDDVAALAAKINQIIDALYAAGVIKSKTSNS